MGDIRNLESGRKWGFSASLASFAAGLALVALVGASAQGAEKIHKYTDFAEGMKVAAETNRPALVDYYTDWCQYCKEMDTTTFINPAVVSWATENVIFIKVNCEDENGDKTKFADSMGVRGYPTFAIYNPDGSEIDRAVGFLDSLKFVQTFTDYMNDKNTLADYLRQEKTSPSVEVNFRLGDRYSWRGLYEQAEGYYQKVLSEDPTNKAGFTVESMMSLADMARRDKEYEKSFTRFQAVLDKFPEDENAPIAHIYQGICLRNNGDTEKAIKSFEEFVKRYPDSEDAEYAQKQIKNLTEELAEKKDQ